MVDPGMQQVLTIRHPVWQDTLIVAMSNGAIARYKLDLGRMVPRLYCQGMQAVSPVSTTIVLSVNPSPTSDKSLATMSGGYAATAEFTIDDMRAQKHWRAHDLEVWCGAWKNPNEVLTGGDDSQLKLWDIRFPLDRNSMSTTW